MSVQVAAPHGGARKTFLLIQVLRAVAALMVVWHHTTYMQNERLNAGRSPWLSGAAGVDLFFVISGFVMAVSSASLRFAPHAMRTFLARRIERVVPLYWLATTVKLCLALAFPLLAPNVVNGTWHIVSSYLFLPSLNALGAAHPVLIVGWTLNDEMFFYLIFAIGLGLRLPLFPYLSVMLAVLGTAGAFRPLGTPAIFSLLDPILFEFLFGVLLGRVFPVLQARHVWHKLLAGSVVVAGFAVIGTHPEEVVRSDRAMVWGLASLAIVGAALALEESLGKWVPRWLLELGDASYSNYLTHTLALAAIGYLLVRYPWFTRAGWLPQTLGCVVLCTLAAEVVYRSVELPIVRFFQGRRARAG